MVSLQDSASITSRMMYNKYQTHLYSMNKYYALPVAGVNSDKKNTLGSDSVGSDDPVWSPAKWYDGMTYGLWDHTFSNHLTMSSNSLPKCISFFEESGNMLEQSRIQTLEVSMTPQKYLDHVRSCI